MNLVTIQSKSSFEVQPEKNRGVDDKCSGGVQILVADEDVDSSEDPFYNSDKKSFANDAKEKKTTNKQATYKSGKSTALQHQRTDVVSPHLMNQKERQVSSSIKQSRSLKPSTKHKFLNSGKPTAALPAFTNGSQSTTDKNLALDPEPTRSYQKNHTIVAVEQQRQASRNAHVSALDKFSSE